MQKLLLIFMALCSLQSAAAQSDPAILSMRERAVVIDEILEKRLDSLVPQLMAEHGIELWIVMAREYNEDPVIRTMLPAKWFAARRTTMLVFFRPGDGGPMERLAVGRYDVGSFKQAWDPDTQPDQWGRLAELIAERNPRKIGINRSDTWGQADGLTLTLYEKLMAALPEAMRERVVSADRLAVAWLETRLPEEIALYGHIVRTAHSIIAEGLSEAVIHPGITTTADVQWWYRERIRELKLQAWFHPSVSVQRSGVEDDFLAAFSGDSRTILPGDLIHVDFGITYLRLNTDTQQHAYVLRPGEQQAPKELQQALEKGNRLQDILMQSFAAGRSGNEVLRQALSTAAAEGLEASIYSHPLGYHGHGAGAAIGMWDNQESVPGTGDHPIRPMTAWSIELNVRVAIPSWNTQVRIMLEEDAWFDGESVRFLDGRQEHLFLVPRQ